MSEKKLREAGIVTRGQEAPIESGKEKESADGSPIYTGKQESDGRQAGKPGISETWAEETIADLDEFIESQGIYIRQ